MKNSLKRVNSFYNDVFYKGIFLLPLNICPQYAGLNRGGDCDHAVQLNVVRNNIFYIMQNRYYDSTPSPPHYIINTS